MVSRMMNFMADGRDILHCISLIIDHKAVLGHHHTAIIKEDLLP